MPLRFMVISSLRYIEHHDWYLRHAIAIGDMPPRMAALFEFHRSSSPVRHIHAGLQPLQPEMVFTL